MNIFAVNATDQVKEKNIDFQLPAELTSEDIVDTGGLKLEYDINKESFFVRGKIELQPKETRTFKVQIKDVWKFDTQYIDEVRAQVNKGFSYVEGTDYEDVATIKRRTLLERLDFIVEQQEQFSGNIEGRIDRYRAYAEELNKIRGDALNIQYWRSKPPAPTDDNILTFVVSVENSSDKETKLAKQKHYLPVEVKPEHIVDTQGFDLKYDAIRGQGYLYKEEELQPKEFNQYQISIVDIWTIPQIDIDNIRDRAREIYALLQNTKFVDSAEYLITDIKDNLEKIELSQSQEKNINEHISAFRLNQQRYNDAARDLGSLEDLLSVVREDLERSRVKNVLQKVKSLNNVADIAKAIFGEKPSKSIAWKIIIGIIIFVGFYTILHFTIWGARSKNVKIEDDADKESKQETAA